MSDDAKKEALRPAPGGMLSLAIANEIARLTAKPEWSSVDRLAANLVKNGALNILLMVLKKGARLAEHRTKGPVAVYVVSGSIGFSAANQTSEVSSGSIIALDHEVVHALKALADSVLLLITCDLLTRPAAQLVVDEMNHTDSHVTPGQCLQSHGRRTHRSRANSGLNR
jgi:quercetin dioxygenase-like cupin family protein